MRKPFVEAVDVARCFGAGEDVVAAVRAATFTVRTGDRIALVGASGSGKSTLLHLMADLDYPTGGRLCWPALGSSGTLRPASIGMVFQAPSLIPSLSAVENVEVPMLLAEGDRAARDVALDALDRVGLRPVADKLPDELSGGQAQRVAVARAIAVRPRLVLADEPTGQLDQATAQHVIDVLLAAIPDTSALVIATHDAAVAARIETVWRMDHGRLGTDRMESRR